MELQQFIEQTISQVTSGLHNSSKTMVENKTGRGIPDLQNLLVEFDIAVTASHDTDSEIGGKISVLGINLSISGKQAQKDITSNVSRIKFTVPIKINTIEEKFIPSVA